MQRQRYQERAGQLSLRCPRLRLPLSLETGNLLTLHRRRWRMMNSTYNVCNLPSPLETSRCDDASRHPCRARTTPRSFATILVHSCNASTRVKYAQPRKRCAMHACIHRLVTQLLMAIITTRWTSLAAMAYNFAEAKQSRASIPRSRSYHAHHVCFECMFFSLPVNY